jgi:hypothetical protein
VKVYLSIAHESRCYLDLAGIRSKPIEFGGLHSNIEVDQAQVKPIKCETRLASLTSSSILFVMLHLDSDGPCSIITFERGE